LFSYSSAIESVGLRKCPHDHQLTNETISEYQTFCQSYTHKMASKTSWRRYGTKLLRDCRCMYFALRTVKSFKPVQSVCGLMSLFLLSFGVESAKAIQTRR